jgi:hypothetical protein
MARRGFFRFQATINTATAFLNLQGLGKLCPIDTGVSFPKPSRFLQDSRSHAPAWECGVPRGGGEVVRSSEMDLSFFPVGRVRTAFPRGRVGTRETYTGLAFTIFVRLCSYLFTSIHKRYKYMKKSFLVAVATFSLIGTTTVMAQQSIQYK